MHRLMAVPVSVVVFLSVVGTTTAQEATSPQPTQSESAPAATTEATAESSAGTPSGVAVPATSTDSTDPQATPPVSTDASPAAQTGTPAVTAVATPEAMDAGTYDVRLRDLEQRINELKEQIFRSKARLSLLAETVLQGVVAGAQAHIVHNNKMGSSYELVRVVYALDGAPIFNKTDESGGLAEREEFDIYNGSIVPGEHTLTVTLQYRGNGYGIFSYLKGYRFNINSSYTFTAAEGKVTELNVIGYEKGGPTAPLEERPQLRFMERLADSKPAATATTPEEEEGGE